MAFGIAASLTLLEIGKPAASVMTRDHDTSPSRKPFQQYCDNSAINNMATIYLTKNCLV